MPLGTRFLKREHLRLRRDFARVLDAKCKAADALFVVYVARNDLAFSRIGISVSKRIGNAVRRHDVKRRIREAFRTGKAELPAGLDIVCLAKSRADRNVAASLRKLIVRAARQCPTCEADRTPRPDPRMGPKSRP